ncbi:LOW QUALITY PROTEIN: cytochrome P450 72A14-like [Pecten maximus]|uniref:LOW QUALITY PROTEIN: cytochrome P450 72A14-like n=1 Tax=Pecten maximus TaxID=6579 RepID=UPI001458578F|nr:LOW QUALITY PROTEIN: cytochrome P450 72A14-like [Pecten maximus]
MAYFSVSWRDVVLYVGLAVFSWYMYKILIKPLLSPLRKIPGTPYVPFFGNMLEARKYEAMTNCIRWMKKLDSKIIRFYFFGGQERVLVADPEIFQHILITNSKYYDRVGDLSSGPLADLLRRPLFVLSGEHHHIVRKICNPGFSLKLIQGMVPIFQERADALIQLWTQGMQTQDGKTFGDINVQADLAKLTSDVICKCGFGYDMYTIENPDTPLVQPLRRLGPSASLRFLDLLPFAKWYPTKRNRQVWMDSKIIEELADKVLQQKKQMIGDKQSWKRPLTSLLNARDQEGGAMSNKDLFGEVIGFLFAGFETTSIGMTWTLLQLAQFPDIQAKVREEVNQVLKEHNGVINNETLDKLKYLTCVIKETLRMLPPIVTMFRKAKRDDTLKGYHIPAGTIVGLHVGALHRLNWEDPDSFKPERFMEHIDNESRKFLPFAVGPYMCIGYKFALLEMKTVLARLIQEFDFKMSPGYSYKRQQALVLRPSPPARLLATKILGQASE